MWSPKSSLLGCCQDDRLAILLCSITWMGLEKFLIFWCSPIWPINLKGTKQSHAAKVSQRQDTVARRLANGMGHSKWLVAQRQSTLWPAQTNIKKTTKITSSCPLAGTKDWARTPRPNHFGKLLERWRFDCFVHRDGAVVVRKSALASHERSRRNAENHMNWVQIKDFPLIAVLTVI